MSTNKERLTKGLIDFVNQECVVGPEYWMSRIEFEDALELFLDEHEYNITWLMPIKCDRDVLEIGGARYPDKQYSLSGELIRLFPDIVRVRRQGNPGLSGIAFKEKEGRTVLHFIRECIIFNPEKRESNKTIITSLTNFAGGDLFDDCLSMNMIGRMIGKEATKNNHEIKPVMYNDNGKTVRGIHGIEVQNG